MQWFQKKEDKDARIKAEEKMKIYLSKPSSYNKTMQSDKYDAALKDMNSMVTKSNQKAIETIVDHIKETIKDDDVESIKKLRAIQLLRDLMQSHNKALGKYVVKKILKRLTILAQHRKNEKDENRGASIFKCKKHEEKFGIEFLRTLLLALEDWGKNWPRNADGPFHNFSSTYNQLLMQKQVSFPIEQKRTSANKPHGGSLPRNSKEENNSPPKPFLDNRMVENFPSKPVIKQRAPLTGLGLQYVTSMKQLLELFSSILKENPQYHQIWPTIKDYVQQFKQMDEQGNFLIAQMIQNGQQNPDLFQAVEANAAFLVDLKKDTGIVDRTSTSYGKYNSKYEKKCKKLALSLSIFVDKPGSSQANNSASLTANKPGIDISINDRLQKVQQIRPKIQQQRNRYGSGNELRNQLQINLQQVKKQDFNSGTHKFNENSEGGAGSSRYNSVHQPDKNKIKPIPNSKKQEKGKEQQSQESQENKQSPEKMEKKVDLFKESQPKKQIEQVDNPFQNKQMSKISEKTENNATKNNFNNFDFENDSQNGKNKVDGSFGDFEMNKSKQEKEDSNSVFFKQKQEKDQGFNGNMRSRKNHNIHKNDNFFETTIKSKNETQNNISAFDKSKSIEQQNKRDTHIGNAQGFDTFKNPQEIASAINDLRKSVKSRTSEVSNPFAPNQPHEMNNSMNRSQVSNPFQTTVPDVSKADNPFETNMNNMDGNPFESRIGQIGRLDRESENFDNKSKISNPFSVKDVDNKSVGKSSIKSKPRAHQKRSQISNPFDTKSQISQKKENSFDEDDPFATKRKMSNISNPFRTNQQKENYQQKSLSKRGSFVNAKNTERISVNKQDPFEDPFENNAHKNSKQSSNSYDKHKKVQKNIDKPHDQLSMQSKEKSFRGFDFSDFMNASGQKSEDVVSKKGSFKANQSGFNFSDFGNANQNRDSFPGFDQKQNLSVISKNNESFDFFNQGQSKVQKQEKQSFFNNSKSLGKEQQTKQQERSVHKNSFDNLAFGFDDFGNASKSSSKGKQKDSSKNPFSDFEVSKGTIDFSKKEREVPKLQIKDKISNISDEEWNKFGSSGQKIGEKSFHQVEQSRYEDSEERNIEYGKNKKDHPWLNKQFNEIDSSSKQNTPDRNSNQIKEPHFGQQQKSISLQFDEPSPFQKKQIPWNYTLAALPSSARYNVTQEDLQSKKQILCSLEQENNQKLLKYKELSEKLASLKRIYSANLEKVSEAKEQKKQFTQILQRLTQSNEIKEKQIEQLIKKTKKAEEIKNKILENEKVLYERMKDEKRNKEKDAGYRQKVGNKWERFNNNLKKQREELQMENSLSNYSYYA